MSEPSTDLATIPSGVMEKVAEGTISMEDLLRAVAPKQPSNAAQGKVVLPKQITDTQRKALERLPEVYGKVVPTERRALEPVEQDALLEEREVLDEIGKMAETRKADIKTTIYNHFDVVAEADEDFDPDVTPVDKDGYYVAPAVAAGTGHQGRAFKRETRGTAPTLSEGALKALAEDESVPEFTHEDYLAMTRAVRVVDEPAIQIHLRKHPEFVTLLSKVVTPGTESTALNIRKA